MLFSDSHSDTNTNDAKTSMGDTLKRLDTEGIALNRQLVSLCLRFKQVIKSQGTLHY